MSEGPYGAEPYPGSGSYPADPRAGYPQPGTADQFGYGSTPAYGAPQPGYGQSAPGYAAYPPYGVAAGYPSAPRNGLGTAALVLGIIGVVFCWIPFTGWALNILAVIFGAIGMGRAKRGEATNRSSALAGLILGAIGLAVWVFIVIAMVAAVSSVGYYS